MHRVSQQDHARSVRPWVWAPLIAVVVISAAVWAVRPDPTACRTAAPGAVPRPATMSVPNTPAAQRIPITEQVDPPVLAQARYYTFGPDVACSFLGLPSDGYYVGVPTDEYDGSAACGGYVDLYGPLGSVRAQIVDHCPGCAAHQYDLSAAAFARIADPGSGVAQIGVSRVHNPSPSPDLVYRIEDGSSSDWLGIQFTDTGNPLSRIEIRPIAGGDGHTLTRRMDNFWTISGAGAGPFTALVTDADGHQAVVPGIVVDPGRSRHTGRSLYALPAQVPVATVSRPAPASMTSAVAVCS
ncbi:expansin EXLX1 family cellulose-binding protein [Nocardia miyunensis]|uniref:expansin EXLX1 family cellulose-binding protein n=1 Tax=Nocardia miyunensis TaxID=282684 RepID=UPI000B01DCEC|nr:expansin EXLX1 family cellulose-binding protein [Nocardia miyunensis]